MNWSIKKALYIAAAILIASAILSRVQNGKLIISTILVLGAIITLIFAFLKDRKKLVSCYITKKNKSKLLGITAFLTLVLFGLGFTVGKLIYLWTH
ncbi:hypothetical protein GCM10011414_27180 [Croceivirga lutea]|uniref:hypothetical protein n=1 Tax=Croceivirga lutea TaxID=1775167 RepID=UPI00163B3A2F|nr:hypothetical protein [Croceivirga lutea]GGG55915.1 hypothetical protein GCM10011414_27180 [Croceivirga lutea]